MNARRPRIVTAPAGARGFDEGDVRARVERVDWPIRREVVEVEISVPMVARFSFALSRDGARALREVLDRAERKFGSLKEET